MSLLFKKDSHLDFILGVWKINETIKTLEEAHGHFSESETESFNGFKNDKRKLEFLSVRVLLKELIENPAALKYNNDGKPFLEDRSFNISISHSNSMIGILLSKNGDPGIDIESPSEKILKVASRFLCPEEMEYLTDDVNFEKATLLWCAKESIYKMFSGHKLNFKNDIRVQSFSTSSPEPFQVDILHPKLKKQIDLHYLKVDQNYIVYGINPGKNDL